jgi:hypothetical protein
MRTTDNWTTYRTRFLVKAHQLDAALTFTDALGREHRGQKGDYLVESSEGLLRIAPREIFEDIYVPMTTVPMRPDAHAAPAAGVGLPAHAAPIAHAASAITQATPCFSPVSHDPQLRDFHSSPTHPPSPRESAHLLAPRAAGRRRSSTPRSLIA